MRFGSVCSGIEAASVAWNPLGWKAAWLAEIEPFPSALLAHRYPNIPNYGDMRGLPELIRKGEIEAPDMLCGGTPCQAFSVAGQRKSLEDERGNLSLVFCEIADAIDDIRAIQGKRPSILFWENVPGVLSVKDNAFGCFVGRLVGSHSPCTTETGRWPRSGYVTGPKRTLAWRTLDAKYFRVPQRRERVFLVASSTEGGVNPSKILFEFPSLCGDSETSEESQKDASAFTPSSFGGYRQGIGTVRASGGDAGGGSETLVMMNEQRVRKLTPIETERLQGFPDNWTQIPWKGKPAEECPDSPRYRAIGNSWCVPCVRWIGKRIQAELEKNK